MGDGKPFRVLSLDGGGMRGTYTATYLSCVADTFAKRRQAKSLDLGAAFDLIVGTSTGGIIACALVAGIPLTDIAKLYREHGRAIFRRQVPNKVGLGLLADLFRRAGSLATGTESLRAALTNVLGEETVGSIYAKRKIALAIAAVEMSQHRSWVFKTQHLENSMGRDNGYSLVDVCMATSAAPIFRSMAVLKRPDGQGQNVFVDGGLWANNPVLIGLIDALEMTTADRPIQIFCIGTCPMPAGEQVSEDSVHRGLSGWKFGSEVATLSIAAQEFAFDNMARMLCKHVNRPKCEILRFPRDQTPAALLGYLSLDDTRDKAIEALIAQARTDAEMTNSRCGDAASREGQLICGLFNDAPIVE